MVRRHAGRKSCVKIAEDRTTGPVRANVSPQPKLAAQNIETKSRERTFNVVREAKIASLSFEALNANKNKLL
jgi:hypothetical protein